MDIDEVSPLESGDAAALSGDAAADLLSLSSERDRLATEKADLHDQLLRRTAEFENFRRRTEREKLELGEYAAMEALRAVLPAMDDFERGLKVVSADPDYARGMELTFQRLLELLKKQGLEPIDTTAATFDPNLHHAIDMVPTSNAPDQTILSEYQRGYRFRGRLLRPALVKVAVAS